MRLHHQALILACVLGLSSCARILTSIFAPQQAMVDAAGQASQAAAGTAPGQDATRMSSELNRLLADRGRGNRDDISALRQEMERGRRARLDGREGSAQADPGRNETWDPRAPPPSRLRLPQPADELVCGPAPKAPPPSRGAPDRPRPIPDGTGQGASARVLDLSPVRVVER